MAQVPRASRRCLPATDTLPPVSPGLLPIGAVRTIRRVPRELRDAPENLPKEVSGQVAFGKLEHEVPSMPDEASGGLEEPLLEARQRPTLDGQRQGQPT